MTRAFWFGGRWQVCVSAVVIAAALIGAGQIEFVNGWKAHARKSTPQVKYRESDDLLARANRARYLEMKYAPKDEIQ